MVYQFKLISQEEVERIISWNYDGVYSFYNMDEDLEDLKEFREDAASNENYWSVYQRDHLIGFFSFHEHEDNHIEIGLGMCPDNVGKGEGFSFLEAGLQKAVELYRPTSFGMAVAEFNKRAIKVYQRAGFQITHLFMQQTNGREFQFVEMKKNLV
ncbi:GNAT family N-acetyltransferase [Alkalihalobacillus hwajinpoensis]|uniref:GNAT family N-acetyltransferase n=1 Tax=Guptibacillus hwajinpoensis TaxID=208199 RepID=UPI001883BB6B|nr:GNAT family N-acetyltransferase [Pseudalkalibacillus hwajinpoensis]MBF0709114.1 GNAT family N-acetyltransferase [Pseudalkalibacillus hwajinpoensis]